MVTRSNCPSGSSTFPYSSLHPEYTVNFLLKQLFRIAGFSSKISVDAFRQATNSTYVTPNIIAVDTNAPLQNIWSRWKMFYFTQMSRCMWKRTLWIVVATLGVELFRASNNPEPAEPLTLYPCPTW